MRKGRDRDIEEEGIPAGADNSRVPPVPNNVSDFQCGQEYRLPCYLCKQFLGTQCCLRPSLNVNIPQV